MPWHAKLQLHYTRDGARSVALDRHEGPLRVLQRLYPEGPGICHHVLVHPPGGIVGGDVLELQARLERDCHALITTPGATRFYRSAGETSIQSVRATLAEGARLEWLPLETIAYSACRAHNRSSFELAAGAEMIGWDLLALGLPAAGRDFEHGRFMQHLELPGAWLERSCIDASDQRLLASPLGWGGRRVLATLWFAAGTALQPARREALLDAAREAIAADAGLSADAGTTAPHERVVVLRALAGRVEPAMRLLQQVRAAWRGIGWALAAAPPRVWRS
ncbi:MAG TPA: urease accessory protein UreD [Rubrivivax sp.]|nr:urease accessory protein UreD [Rubrivivax sp.]